jgi:hypothetical protein
MATFGQAQAVRGGASTICTAICRWQPPFSALVIGRGEQPSSPLPERWRGQYDAAPTKAAMMQNIPIYEALAQAFAAEGVDSHFTLMGDGTPQTRRTVSRGHGKM